MAKSTANHKPLTRREKCTKGQEERWVGIERGRLPCDEHASSQELPDTHGDQCSEVDRVMKLVETKSVHDTREDDFAESLRYDARTLAPLGISHQAHVDLCPLLH